jgi:hypothetical protein
MSSTQLIKNKSSIEINSELLQKKRKLIFYVNFSGFTFKYYFSTNIIPCKIRNFAGFDFLIYAQGAILF